MATPVCSDCGKAMECVRVSPVIQQTGSAGQRAAIGHRMRAAGHPLLALGMTLYGGVAFLGNRIWQEVEYKCTICGSLLKKVERKR